MKRFLTKKVIGAVVVIALAGIGVTLPAETQSAIVSLVMLLIGDG